MELQGNHLLNRGILDLFGACIPMIALTRNKTERREVTLERAMVLFSAFILAPLHAALFVWLSSRNVPRQLMRLSLKELISIPALKTGVEGLKRDIPKKMAKIQWGEHILDETLRKKLINAKTKMFIPDLILESLIFANMGWILNAFTKKKTGKDQFSGEMKAVDEKSLDELYKKEHAKKENKLTKHIATLGLPFIVPIGLGLVLRNTVLKGDKAKGALKTLQNIAHRFDYRHGIWMGIGTLVVVVAMQYLGSLLAARSPRELKETFIRDGLTNFSFFLGEPLFMWLVTQGLFRKLKFTPHVEIPKIIASAKPEHQLRAGKIASGAWVGSFILNVGFLTSIIVLFNHLTINKVKQEAGKLEGEKLQTLFNNGGPLSHKPPFQRFAHTG